MSRARLTLALLLLALATGTLMAPSVQEMGEHGVSMLSYEFTGTPDRAQEFNATLGADGLDAARMSLWWDFGFLVSYGLLLAVLCLGVASRAATRGRDGLAAKGRLFAVLAVVAAACDAGENISLLRLADGHTDQPWPALGFGFAAVKWVLAAGAVVYVVAGWLMTRQASTVTDNV